MGNTRETHSWRGEVTVDLDALQKLADAQVCKLACSLDCSFQLRGVLQPRSCRDVSRTMCRPPPDQQQKQIEQQHLISAWHAFSLFRCYLHTHAHTCTREHHPQQPWAALWIRLRPAARRWRSSKVSGSRPVLFFSNFFHQKIKAPFSPHPNACLPATLISCSLPSPQSARPWGVTRTSHHLAVDQLLRELG